ncbi:TOBE domain-containing protein [Clostridium sp. 2218st1_F5_2218SCRN_220325]|uniref:TOBE domain-containing protein n=1 Tax=Clostridium sp. 2218st1_F5_2218SCRN_220325 TaxID=3143056 RepID=UPI00319DE9C8
MNLSTRNKLTGKIIDVNKGAVNEVVKVELPNGMIVTSTISLAAIEELELEVGKEATAVIKATSVMMG